MSTIPVGRSERLQVHLAQMRAVPLPLAGKDALDRAILLRRKHYTYGAIAKVMGDYHGVWQSSSWWRKACLRAGGPHLYPGREARLP